MNDFEAIVVGAGHAGIEATFALANKGHKTLLISLSEDRIAQMPCNPSIGGPAKGIITREIDAIGGVQGFYADKAMIQLKMLNSSKGPAVQALRAQIDKELYSQLIKDDIKKHKNITFLEAEVTDLLLKNNTICGVHTSSGDFNAKVVVLTTGTYMNSFVMRGHSKIPSGPDDQKQTNLLSKNLKKYGIELQRLKTGTPPRVATKSVDFSKVHIEDITTPNITFSSRSNVKITEQISCYLTYTNKALHDLIRENIDKSTMYSGLIEGVGARYCPSIEDKIVRFADKERHQIFYEPETAKGDVIYIQGFSTSMPIDIQEKMIKLLPGMANAEVIKWAYAIEYDAINPLQLKPSLEAKKINCLFFAGQINGTSGYEEAAGQGLIAGINAALLLEKREPLILRRDQAYIGVLIDDLVTKGTTEPYRMLTSRAEYRLLLRNDNADERLGEIGYKINLLSATEYQKIVDKYNSIAQSIEKMSNTYLSSNSELAKKYEAFNGPSLLQLLLRPEVDYRDLNMFEYIFEIATRVRLEGYIKKQETEAKKLLRLESLKIPQDINYELVPNLATEARQKLLLVKPITIGQASRIAGINPADIQMIMFYMEQRRRLKNEN